MRVGVGGVDLALVLHHACKRQRLAARARAKVEDLHAGLGFREERGELRAFVLQLDEALDVGRVGGERRRAAVRAHGDAEPHGRERRRLGLEVGERAERFVAIGLEGVHAQIDGRSLGERPALLRGGSAEARFQLRREPFGEIPKDVRGRARKVRSRKPLAFGFGELCRRVTLAGEQARRSRRRRGSCVCLSAPSISARGLGSPMIQADELFLRRAS